MRVLETPGFREDLKRLHAYQKNPLDDAMRAVLADPKAGEQKSGDLAWLRVFKFRTVDQLMLLAYEIIDEDTMIQHAVGTLGLDLEMEAARVVMGKYRNALHHLAK